MRMNKELYNNNHNKERIWSCGKNEIICCIVIIMYYNNEEKHIFPFSISFSLYVMLRFVSIYE